MHRLPDHGPCFVCGSENPTGMGLQLYVEGGQVVTTAVLGLQHQGPPGHAHGGSLAAIVDELMGAAAWAAGKAVLAAKIEVNFRAPAPLGAELKGSALVVRQEGRKVFTEARITLPDGRVCAEGAGLFIEAREFFGGKTERAG